MELKIAETIRAHRTKNALTQEYLASMLGVTKAAVSKWELGQTYPDVPLLPKLASVFHITTDELFGYSLENTEASERILYKYAIYKEEFADVLFLRRCTITDVKLHLFEDAGKWEYRTYVQFHTYDTSVREDIRTALLHGKWMDSIEENERDGTVHHVWITKEGFLKFRPGEQEKIKECTKELIRLGYMTEDDLY